MATTQPLIPGNVSPSVVYSQNIRLHEDRGKLRTDLETARTQLLQEVEAHKQTKSKLELEQRSHERSKGTIRSLERKMEAMELKAKKDSGVKEQDGKTTKTVTAMSTNKGANNSPKQTPSISYEFDVLFYKRGTDFLLVSSEEEIKSCDCSIYRDIRRHARDTLRAQGLCTSLCG